MPKPFTPDMFGHAQRSHDAGIGVTKSMEPELLARNSQLSKYGLQDISDDVVVVVRATVRSGKEKIQSLGKLGPRIISIMAKITRDSVRSSTEFLQITGKPPANSYRANSVPRLRGLQNSLVSRSPNMQDTGV
jgi:hypothetical protein